jgi:hypothetical protein
MIAYHDATAGSLKLALRSGENLWTNFVVDEGTAIQPEIGGEQAGRSISISIDPITGRVGIAYLALVVSSGQMTSELRFAESTGSTPLAGNDFSISVVDTGAATAPTSTDPDDLPPAVGLFVASARKLDGSPVLAYYDGINGDLKLATRAGGTWTTQIIDGDDGTDQGYYPSIQVDGNDVVHVVYVNAFHDALTYLDMTSGLPEVIDDGYREDGTTADGLPVPVFHFVGDDSALMLASGGAVAVAYQDATSHELLLATRNPDGTWTRESLAGSEDPFVGGYGFYAAARSTGAIAVISTWVINQKTPDSWVEVFKRQLAID